MMKTKEHSRQLRDVLEKRKEGLDYKTTTQAFSILQSFFQTIKWK